MATAALADFVLGGADDPLRLGVFAKRVVQPRLSVRWGKAFPEVDGRWDHSYPAVVSHSYSTTMAIEIMRFPMKNGDLKHIIMWLFTEKGSIGGWF